MPPQIWISEWLTKLSPLHTALTQVYFGSGIELCGPQLLFSVCSLPFTKATNVPTHFSPSLETPSPFKQTTVIKSTPVSLK